MAAETSRPHFLRELRVGLRIVAAWATHQLGEPVFATSCPQCHGRPLVIHGFELEDGDALLYWLGGRWPYAGGHDGVRQWRCFPTWAEAERWALAERELA